LTTSPQRSAGIRISAPPRFEPTASLAAVYDFDASGLDGGSPQSIGANGFRGKAQMGLGLTLPSGLNFPGGWHL